VEVLDHLEILWALDVGLLGLAAVIWGIRGLIRDHLNDRLARRALEIVAITLAKMPQDQVFENATETLRALAKFVEAQHAKPHLPKLPRPPSLPP
jgi:hypothetical protein